MAMNNEAIKEALKTMPSTKWIGNTEHDTIESCLTAINLETLNSGWYKPKAVKLFQAIYMLNEDGTIWYNNRIVKTEDNKYRIEELTLSGYNLFEEKYLSLV